MEKFPNIHPDKCPFCKSDLKLVTGKYVWDYYYSCTGCHKKYHCKDEKIPDIKSIYHTDEYKHHVELEERRNQSDKEFRAAHPELFVAPASPNTAPVATSKPVHYVCVHFTGTYERATNGGTVEILAEQHLQKYLNDNNIHPSRIVAINSAAWNGPYITLVHY